MDFALSPDEEALRAGVRELCERHIPLDRVRAGDPTVWRDLADAGVFSLRLPEAAGGAALGLTEAALVFEELGRALVPGPLVATHLAAGLVGDGAVVTVVEQDARPVLVEHLATADVLVVLRDDALIRVDPRTIDARPVRRPVDPLTPLHALADLPDGDPVGDADTAARWRRDGAVLTAALQVGIAAATTDMAVGHARERQQFGRPIGSFQAVKHICADMLVRAEVARAAVHAAAVTVDDPEVGDVRRAVATAKLMADEAALLNGRAGVQVHGGMGFTWEMPVHLYLKRTFVLGTVFGTADDHADDLAALL